MLAGATLNFALVFAVGVSLFGCFATIALALNQRPSVQNFLWRKPLVGSIFALICWSGMIATFFPRKCSETFYMQEALNPTDSSPRDSGFHGRYTILVGHHPSCGRFSPHTVRIDGRVLCAACTGLLFGGIAAFVGTVVYFFGGLDLGQFGLWAVLVGQAGTLLGFVQFKFSGYARLITNAIFVFAAYLTLAGIDGLVGDFFIDIYMVVLIIFWLWTRITISQWDHWRICRGCQHPCAA